MEFEQFLFCLGLLFFIILVALGIAACNYYVPYKVRSLKRKDDIGDLHVEHHLKYGFCGHCSYCDSKGRNRTIKVSNV
jgi:hypothetical protein